MPLYEYKCEDHGSFEIMLTLSERKGSIECPTCHSLSKRVFTMPSLRGMSPSLMEAHERNERSRQAPHVCGSTCNHQHGKPAKNKTNPDGSPKKPTLQSYTGKRPWVIEHA